MSGNLTPADLDLHLRLGIPGELLEAAQVRRVTHEEARSLLGVNHHGDLAGLVYPRVDPVSGREVGYRVRRDHPEIEAGRPRAKYLSSVDRAHLCFPPGADAQLYDSSVTVVIVEAEKSALALTAAAMRADRRLLVVGLGGCWGWKGRIGKATDANGARVDERGPVPDLALVTWPNRDVVIMLDANAATNPQVQAARRALAKELTGRGARVRIGELPIEDGINGPDDYIGRHGDAAFFARIDAAKPASTPQGPDVYPVLVRLADVRPEPVTWLWLGRLAAGKLALLVGDPGLGKSWITLDIAARVSAARAWPDGGAPTTAGDVLLLSAEDGLADTIRPRLDALGADVTHVHHLAVLRAGEEERAIQLTDTTILERAVRETGARVLVIDPVSAYLGSTDSHRDSEVRGLIAPLAALAERTGVAILGVMHLAKSSQRPAIYRAVGSIAFTAAARIVLAVAADPERDDRRIVAPIKSNLAGPPPALAYTLADGRLMWEPDPVSDIDVDALLAGPALDRQEHREADAWLRKLLANGPMLSKEIEAAAEHAGIARRTLFRAKARLHVEAERIGGTTRGAGKWYWTLHAIKSASNGEVAPLIETQPNTADLSGSEINSANSHNVAPLRGRGTDNGDPLATDRLEVPV